MGKTLIFINPLMATKRQPLAAWLRFVVWSQPEPVQSVRQSSSLRSAAGWFSMCFQGQESEPLTARGEHMPQLWLSLLFCAVPVELHASLSVQFSMSMSLFWGASRDFCLLQRQVGAPGGAACESKRRPGPGSVAAARAFLCGPYLNTVRDLEIKGASQFLLFISVLSVALLCRGAEGSEVKSHMP